MRNPESILKSDTHKLFCDLETQTDLLIAAKRPNIVIVKEIRTCRIVDFAVPTDHRELGIKWYIQGSLNKFRAFFPMGTFIGSSHMKL